MSLIKGRGAQINPANRFLKAENNHYYDDLPTHEEREELALYNAKTKIIEVHPKTIVNKVDSPDLGFNWSLNPYQGCEHGCVYCYARNSHEYWDFSAGMDFEQNILVKKNAAELLREKLLSKNWKAEMISLAGNTDCYQPIERKLQITRSLLEVFLALKHPVGVITKNSLIERDIDILSDLAKDQLTGVMLSLTTLDEDLKRLMEPRTSGVRQVLRSIEQLSKASIPVGVMMAPIIPGFNDHEIFELVKQVADRGAVSVGYTILRLNGATGPIFDNWLGQNFPDRKQKFLHRMQSLHGGSVNDNQFGRRMKGEGQWSDMIRKEFQLAKKKFMPDRVMPKLNCTLFKGKGSAQLNLFE